MADGDITCAALVDVQIKADELWADNAANKEFIARTDTAKAILAEQTARIVESTDLTDPDKDKTVKLDWVDHCDHTVADYDANCSFTGSEGEATCKSYTISEAKQAILTIPEDKFRTSRMSWEEFVARGILSKTKDLDEEISKIALAKLDTFVGQNENPNAPGDVVGTDTYIKPSYWGPEIMAYFAETEILNSSRETYLLDGNNLFRQSWLAQYKALNANEKDGQAMLDTIPIYHDLFNMQSEIGQNILYQIDKGAVALVSKNRYSTTPREITNGADRIRFAVPSRNLDGIMYDVIYKTRCVGEDIYHDWKFIARFDLFQNPTSACNPTNTGVLKITCGEAP